MITIQRAEIISEIMYGIHQTPFGWCLLGVTNLGICHISFLEKNTSRLAKHELKRAWPKATLIRNNILTKSIVVSVFSPRMQEKKFTVVVQGTDFQCSVWNALTNIPFGTTTTYTDIAEKIGTPKAVRAVGTACGKNDICILIPCHRVLTSAGKIGGYRWGTTRKKQLLEWEKKNA
jgi:AraC family transcriptional regulator, regulatory protein of adaptative response / methylated-DNA-[protein]-cysteine methyltransferase